MVARISGGSLVVTLWRDGEVVDALPARTGERALAIAVMLLQELGPLQSGDKLDVTGAPDEVLPETSRASHYS